MSADFELDPKDTAFVFIEYQNEFTTEGGKLHGAVKECMEATNSKYIQMLMWYIFGYNRHIPPRRGDE